MSTLTELQVFERWYAAKQRQTISRSRMAWARLGYQAHNDRIAALEEEIFEWKQASGLVDGHGDPDGVKPEHLQGCTIYKQKCSEHGHVHGQEAEELRKGVEEILSEGLAEGYLEDALQKLLDGTDARDSLAFLEAKDK